MAIKDNIAAIKEELNSEEQFLESMIKGERFFKKYKIPIIAFVAVLVVGTIGYNLNNYMANQTLIKTNEAYHKLLTNPKDSASIAILKSNNPKLLVILEIKEQMNKNQKVTTKIDDKILNSLIRYYNASKDAKIEDLSKYGNSQNAILKDFATLQEGYLFLKQKNKETADIKFSQIPLNSPLTNITTALKHYK